jgi:hypothetical protein
VEKRSGKRLEWDTANTGKVLCWRMAKWQGFTLRTHEKRLSKPPRHFVVDLWKTWSMLLHLVLTERRQKKLTGCWYLRVLFSNGQMKQWSIWHQKRGVVVHSSQFSCLYVPVLEINTPARVKRATINNDTRININNKSVSRRCSVRRLRHCVESDVRKHSKMNSSIVRIQHTTSIKMASNTAQSKPYTHQWVWKARTAFLSCRWRMTASCLSRCAENPKIHDIFVSIRHQIERIHTPTDVKLGPFTQ